MSKTPAKATEEKSRQPRFPDGKFFHDVPLFGLEDPKIGVIIPSPESK